MQTIERIVSTVNRRVDESNPMVDARLPTGERVNVIIPPLALTGPTLTIRRFPRAYTLPELIGLGSLDEQMLMLLAAFVRARFNVIVSGGTGSGKTTLLNALSGLIPSRERIITIEDSPNSSSSRNTSSGWSPAPRTSRARATSPSATWSATPSVCGPTASSSARSAAARPSTCSRRCRPVTTVPWPPSTRTRPRTPS